MDTLWDFAVIGGGASGMAASVAAAKLGDRVLLLEKSPALGRKVAASGNGRCNLMNTGKPIYYGDSFFANDILHCFPYDSLVRFWESLGLFLTEDSEGRVYPGTFHASSVNDALKTALRQNEVTIRLQTSVLSVVKSGQLFWIRTDKGDFTAPRILIAAGGPASPKLGGTDAGFRILSSFGHHIVPPLPALCPVQTDRKSISGLSGIRSRCAVTLYDIHHRNICSHRGEVLFTDYGISGICVMQCARYITHAGFTLELDLLDPFRMDNSDVILVLKDRRKRFGLLPPEYLLNGILLPKLSFAVIKQAGISIKDRMTMDLSDDDLNKILQVLRAYCLKVTGTLGLEDAQVSAGGASCKEFLPETLESRIVPGLHASGEVLNVDGDCGGYNLMFAFSSGILAGMNRRAGTGCGI